MLGERYPDTFAGTVTALATTVITPSAGKSIEVYWVYALTDPDSDTSPLITVSLGTRKVYSGYAISHTATLLGGINQPVVIELSESATVAVTIHYKEV